MRVLVVNRYWKPLGGVEQCVRDLAGVLEEREHEVVPFAMQDPANWPSEYSKYFPSAIDPAAEGLGARLRVLRRATTAHDTKRLLGRLLDDVEIDVAHVFNAYHHLGTVALLELHRRGIPVVWSLHDYKLGCPNVILHSERTRQVCTVCLDHRSGYAWAPPIVRCRAGSVSAGLVLSAEAVATHVTRVYRRVPTVVTVLNSLQRRAAARAGVPDELIHHVPNFIDISAAEPEAQSGARGAHVLFAGRLTASKGVDVLVRACAIARLPLRVVGDGPARAELEQLAREVGADATFTGDVDRGEVATEMARAAALAVPSLWPDVAPLVVAEGWAAGVPVVGSDLGGLGELIADGRGLPCPAGDEAALAAALRSVVGDPAKAADLVARGRAFAREEMSRSRWIERMTAVYRQAGRDL
jgi:glycosyltransferase involved in cell wall biosynthesis